MQGKASSNRPYGGKPPVAGRNFKKNTAEASTTSQQSDAKQSAALSRIKNESEKSKLILEKQAVLEQKRKQLSLEQALNNGEKGSPSKPLTQPYKLPRSLIEPVNKVTPFDKEKSEACLDLVKRLR